MKNIVFFVLSDYCGALGLYAKALREVGYDARVVILDHRTIIPNQTHPWDSYILCLYSHHHSIENPRKLLFGRGDKNQAGGFNLKKTEKSWLKRWPNLKEYFQEWADYVIFGHSNLVSDFDIKGKKVYVFHGGSKYRLDPEQTNKLFNPIVDGTIIQTPDLLNLGAKNEVWIPPPMDIDALPSPEYTRKNKTKLIVGHFFYRPERKAKGSIAIKETIDKLPKKIKNKFKFWFPEEEVSWKDNIERIEKCDILIDAIQLTSRGRRYGAWGMQALEAACMGKIVLSHSYDKYYKEVFGRCGILPINSIPQLRKTLISLSEMNSTKIMKLKKDTRRWAEKYHSFNYVGNRIKKEVFKDE